MSRDTIVARVRSALGRDSEATSERRRAVAGRLASPPRHPVPAFATLNGSEREAQLVRCLEGQGVDVAIVADLTALPAAVEALLARARLSSQLLGGDRAGENQGDGNSQAPGGSVPLAIGDDARLAALAWPGTVAPTLWSPGQTLGDGAAALTHALAAVAETGTLVLVSGPASPGSLAFLPEIHLVAVARDTVVGSFEQAFARLRQEAPLRLPRAVNLVSGASRTGDIGGKIVRGAHGPRRLVVILYGPPPAGHGAE